ncbi:RGCVC family protein [Amycolatopsis sp. VS8301801F10]|uniref:RGCVC family protein n=2 Tax=unclassified Amycolatopsis TaxID=2618356 RepID=UPI0038FC6730
MRAARTPAAACPVCPHEKNTHDPIANRFCAATAAGARRRRCACAAGSRETRKEEQHMTAEPAFVSRYDQRVARVRDLLEQDTGLTETACQALAVRLLRLIDEAPEKLRR